MADISSFPPELQETNFCRDIFSVQNYTYVLCYAFFSKLMTRIRKLTENCICRIEGDLILGSVPDESFAFREGNITRSCSITLIVSDDFYFAMLENTNTGIRSPEIDSYGRHISEFNRKIWHKKCVCNTPYLVDVKIM